VFGDAAFGADWFRPDTAPGAAMRSEHLSPVCVGIGPLRPRELRDTVSTGGPPDAGPRGGEAHWLGHRARDGTESVDRPLADPGLSSAHEPGADGGGQVREAGSRAGRADLYAASNLRRASGSSCAAPCTKSSIRVSFPRPTCCSCSGMRALHARASTPAPTAPRARLGMPVVVASTRPSLPRA